LKTTFIKILFSIGIIWLSLIGLSQVYSFALSKNCNIKASYIQSQHIDATILIHGPCEPLWMIYPKLLDRHTGIKSYNLALSHSDFADNYLHLYLYLKLNKAPKYLFLFVTPESMDYKYNTFYTYRFAPYIGDSVIDSVVMENDSAYFMWTKAPFMKYAFYSSNINFDVLQGLKHYRINKTIPRFADGYEPPFHRVWDNHLDAFIKLYPNGYLFQWGNLREKYLRKIIELSQQHGVRVILYESPVLKEALAYQPNRTEVVNRIRGIASEYGVEYVQFEGMEMANSRKYFTSALNTTIEGSRIFTDSLGGYIKTLVQKRGNTPKEK
jgi:hypothetical protein